MKTLKKTLSAIVLSSFFSLGLLSPAFANSISSEASVNASQEDRDDDDKEDKKEDARLEASFKLKTLVGFLSQVNASENFLVLRGNRKVMTQGAVMVKITEDGAKVVGLSELTVGAKTKLLVKKPRGSQGEYQALLIFQVMLRPAPAPAPSPEKPKVQFSSLLSSGRESATFVKIPVRLRAPSREEVKVTYAVSGGTATGGGVDYSMANGELVFAPGETSKDITLKVVDDSADELRENVLIKLSNPTNATLGPRAEHTYTIKDND